MFFFQNLPWGTKGKIGGPKEKIWKKGFFQEWRWRNFSLTFLEPTLKKDLETINLSSVWFGVGCNIGWVTSDCRWTTLLTIMRYFCKIRNNIIWLYFYVQKDNITNCFTIYKIFRCLELSLLKSLFTYLFVYVWKLLEPFGKRQDNLNLSYKLHIPTWLYSTWCLIIIMAPSMEWFWHAHPKFTHTNKHFLESSNSINSRENCKCLTGWADNSYNFEI